ncbi:probable E3 ubiquitin-protein ligase XBOS34 [Mercurialis annua]|uniref:probable E3 ubiquitin-protein ligase XBOS34 n=1 Tax=Mercurialis annua TaxID=3986 RepID=UPI0024AE628A|nr:probable E3 ubiquitin-protein ligase XBOS34 [Mercurialis annua]
MGQTLNTMAQQNQSKEELSMGQTPTTKTQQNHSKEELLHQLVLTTNVDAIKALCTQGVDLEWVDKEGKTALMVACMEAGLSNVAKTLIQLGANVNAYRPGRHAGTPLHHAAKRGLHQTVLLLLASGANTLVVNDEWLLALDVARTKRHTNVVRAIENHMCLFSGWLREFQGPGFLEALVPQLLSRKMFVSILKDWSSRFIIIYDSHKLTSLLRLVVCSWDVCVWVVITPHGSSKSLEAMRLELAIYTTLQIYISSIEAAFKVELLSNINELGQPSYRNMFIMHIWNLLLFSQQSELFSNIPLWKICASIQSAALTDTGHSAETANTNSCGKYVHGESYSAASSHSEASSSVRVDNSTKEEHNGWGVWPFGWSVWPFSKQGRVDTQTTVPVAQTSGAVIPSAPPIPDEGPIQYPSIDSSPVDYSAPPEEHASYATSNVKNEGDSASSCIICWEAPMEGACIPCGHIAGCMGCLSEIKAKKGVCPICRNKIDQVLKLYAV